MTPSERIQLHEAQRERSWWIGYGECAIQEALTRFEKVMKAHGVASIIAQYRYATWTRTATRAGMPRLETELFGGYTDVEDVSSSIT